MKTSLFGFWHRFEKDYSLRNSARIGIEDVLPCPTWLHQPYIHGSMLAHLSLSMRQATVGLTGHAPRRQLPRMQQFF